VLRLIRAAACQVLGGIGGEFAAAGGGAEVMRLARMHVPMRARSRIDRHPADRIERGGLIERLGAPPLRGMVHRKKPLETGTR
jgi:hypothetical protein